MRNKKNTTNGFVSAFIKSEKEKLGKKELMALHLYKIAPLLANLMSWYNPYPDKPMPIPLIRPMLGNNTKMIIPTIKLIKAPEDWLGAL